MKKLTFAVCALTLLSSSAAIYATTATSTPAIVGNAEAGKEKSAVCAACHGPDGNSLAPLWPKLAGQHENYLLQQIQAFKVGTRSEPTMSPMAAPLSDQDMADLAAYFATQVRQPGTAGEKSMPVGQKIYRGGNKATGLPACGGCHGPAGAGNAAANYPSVNSQQVDYVKKQLDDYKSGARGKEGKGIIMRDIAAKMTPDEIQAVTDYIAGLH
jgi:cytochrome c553